MEPQLQNWHSFCQYHIGDWHGTWTRYAPTGEAQESFQCIRSFRLSEDGNQVHHQNHYTYADGTQTSKTFEIKTKPITQALFLDNSFSWGSQAIQSGCQFFIETGFSHENRRISVVAVYDPQHNLERIVAISEHLGSFVETDPGGPRINQGNDRWQGTLRAIKPNWVVSSLSPIPFKALQTMNESYLTLHLRDGISTSLPPQLAAHTSTGLIVDWLIEPTLLNRGIRYYDATSFTEFTLTQFCFA
ncbi:MAG: DUF3598 family protein [Cyanothece sp. SIO1E1]|nr:DUF3598 family protein [Cyanothece sp. SIO1E1]